MFRKKFFKHDTREDNQLVHGKKVFEGSVPEKQTASHVTDTLQVYAFKDLQTRGIIDVAATPNETVLKSDQPYALIAKTNRVIDSPYGGVETLKGNALVRIFNSDKTQLLNIFDIGTINARVNYLYAAYATTDDNIATNIEINKVMDEALSKGYSTMLTQLPFYTDFVTSDMPDPDNPANTISQSSEVKGKSALLLHYQSVLQNIVSPMAKYILALSLEEVMMNMSYRREAPIITALMGMLKKKAFVATMNALGTTILADYFDTNWYKQINTMANLCSRKSDAMDDPLLTISLTHRIARTKIYANVNGSAADDPYYDSNDLKTPEGIWINPDSFTLDGTNEVPVSLSFEELVYRINRMLDPSTILTWARQLNAGELPGSPSPIGTPSAYYQQLYKMINALQILAAKFTSSMTEIRTFLDKMTETGMIYWEKGRWIAIDKIAQVHPSYNMIVSHVFQIVMGGASEIHWDDKTQRWRFHTLWNKYEGIAGFDLYTGGSFLTCSLRSLYGPVGASKKDTIFLVPKLFTTALRSGSNSILFTNRGGVRLPVDVVNDATANEDPSLARLDPLNEGFYIRKSRFLLPASLSDTNTNKLASAGLAVLTKVAGYGSVYKRQVGTTTLTFICSAVDPDLVCFTDRELEDVSNGMITYCRNYAPFRVATPDGKRTIGFGH